MFLAKKGKYQAGLRFRRWTRKTYAVFSSLGREVTIGRLSMTMVPVAMLKLRNAVCLFNIDDFLVDDNQEDQISAENIALVPCLITITAERAGDVNPFINILLTKTVGMVR